MSTHLALAPSTPTSRRERRVERRRLERCDTLTGRLAELHAMRSLLQRAGDVVAAGWVQEAWFAVSTRSGTRVVAAHDVRRAARHPVVGACLVGGVVQAGGGPRSVRSQLVRRTLDLTWHTLYEDPAQPVRWCPGPDVRLMRLLDLTRWNDTPGRTQGEVVDLLLRGQLTVDLQRELCHMELCHIERGHIERGGTELAEVGLRSEPCAPSPTARPEIPTY